MAGRTDNQEGYRFGFYGMEADNETAGTGHTYTTELRILDTRLGRWFSMDPMMAKFPWQSPYVSMDNNPISIIDPTGGEGNSTHTDSKGKVIAVYDDGDLGVYNHGDGVTKVDIDKKRNSYALVNPLSGGGEKMGETAYWDEFINIETNKADGHILFGEKQKWEPLIDWGVKHAKNQDLTVTMEESKLNGVLDIKNNKRWASKGVMTGRLLNGKYATARSAGNYLAGMNGILGTLQGRHISGETYMKLAGAYQVGKLTKFNILRILTYGESFGPPPYYGEQRYSGRRIQEGIDDGYKKLKDDK